MRTFVTVLISFSLVLSAPAGAHSPATTPTTAASLTRDQFESRTGEIKKTTNDKLFASYGRPEQLTRIESFVEQEFEASPHRPEFNFNAVRPMVRGWILMLALSRDGFHEVALIKLSESLVAGVGRINELMRKRGTELDVAAADRLMVDLMTWSVRGSLNESGFLRRHELERIYLGLRNAADHLRSAEFAKEIQKPMVEKMQSHPGYVSLFVLLVIPSAFSVFLGGVIFAKENIVLNSDPSVGLFQVAGISLALITSLAAAVAGADPVVSSIARWHALRKAKYKDLNFLGQSCAEMLTASGEVIP